MNKDLKEKFAFTLGATHVGIFHNIGGTFHKLVESFTHVGISHNIGGTLHRFVESFTHVGISHITRRVAFTLAEVLITLGIIGIVSAMTIPTLINNYKEKVRDNQFKKVYATLNQALRMTLSDFDYTVVCYYKDGVLHNKDCPVFWKTFKSKLRVVKSCNSNSFAQGCIPHYDGFEILLKEKHKDDTNYDEEYWDNYANTNLGGLTTNHLKTMAQSLVLNDGTIIIHYGHSRYVTPKLYVDINGFAGPNKFNHDVFGFNTKLVNNKIYWEGERLIIGGIMTAELIRKLFGTKGY